VISINLQRWGAVCGFLGLTLIGDVASEEFPLPDALNDSSIWTGPDFADYWQPRDSPTHIAHRLWPDPVEVFGLRPHHISARFEGAEIQSLTLLFLDSGTHFGYVASDLAVQTEKDNREDFHVVYQDTVDAVRNGLGQLAGGNAEPVVLGSEAMLRVPVQIYRCGDLFARLHAIDDQLVKVTFFPTIERAKTWLSGRRLTLDERDWLAELQAQVEVKANGDHLLSQVPLFPQGDRAYCGVSALSMTMQYLGLDIDTEDYAAAAGIRYGSTRGSKIREIYSEAADELDARMRRSTRFDFGRMRASIDAGIPVLIWRRWSQERDYLHTQFARRFAADPTLTLPPADANDRDLWPDKDAYNHATVITGYNLDRGEIIFTESWGEAVRNRRMRIAEMEATCYYAFFFSP